MNALNGVRSDTLILQTMIQEELQKSLRKVNMSNSKKLKEKNPTIHDLCGFSKYSSA